MHLNIKIYSLNFVVHRAMIHITLNLSFSGFTDQLYNFKSTNILFLFYLNVLKAPV